MIATIKGKVTYVEPSNIIIENQGIGYSVFTPNSYKYKLNQEYTLFTHHYIREDQQNLFGFSSLKLKKLFTKLISVKGVGPKTALSILASEDIDGINNAIENSDINYLKKFPGIGPKSSQQIILDLKGKLITENINNPKLLDLQEALISLGYKKREINKVIKSLDYNESIDVLIKISLRRLLGKWAF